MINLNEIKRNRQQTAKAKDNTSSLGEKIKYFATHDFKIFSNFNEKYKERFFAELGLLLSAGVDLQTTLELTSTSSINKKLHKVYHEILLKIADGAGLSQAMQSTGNFNNFDCYSILIGENTGDLTSIFNKLQVYYNKKITQKRKILSALSYPIIVLLTTTISVFFMLKFVVPMFADTLIRFGGELPFLTRVVISLSDYASSFLLYTLFISILITIWYQRNKKRESVQKIISNAILKIPYFGKLVRKIYLLRFTQSMDLLLTAHVSIIDSIQLTQKMIDFYPLSTALENIKVDVLKGNFFYKSIEKQEFFDKSIIMLIKIGEEVNQLDKIFTQLSKQYENELEYQSTQLLTILEPVMILLLAVVIGTILIAMYLPMFKIGTAIQ